MKRIYFSLFILCSVITAFSEEYSEKTLKVGRRWEMMSLYYGNGEHPDTVYHTLKIDKQIEINGKTIYRAYNKHWSYLFFYFYEENGKIYSCDENMNNSILQLDYSLDVGKYSQGDMVVKVDYINMNGKTLRRISFNTYSFNGEQVCWVEGIGSSYASLFAHYGTVVGTFMGSWVLSVWDDNTCIFNRSDFHQIGEKSSSIYQLENKGIEQVKKTFNLLGHRLTAQPKSGVYIRDGKKYVVK